MYIRKISINNITSLKGRHVIDFTSEPLRSASLFAITGDTGAGKSTILDAVCLALYNNAPRFTVHERALKSLATKQTDKTELRSDDPRNMLRRGETEGSCEVEFVAGRGCYVASWSVRVKRTGTYASAERSLMRISPDKHVFDSHDLQSQINQIIGLDYDQFTRTVILAQNSFANFLKARRDDKSKLLEKITGTEIYTAISKKIYEQSISAANDYNLKQNECEGLKVNILDERSLADYENKLKLVNSTIEGIANSIENLKKQLDWYDNYDRLEARAKTAQDDYNRATRENVSIAEKREKVQRYDDVAGIRDKVVALESNRSKILENQDLVSSLLKQKEEKQQDRSRASAVLEDARSNLEKAQNYMTQMSPQFEKAHEIHNGISYLEKELADRKAEMQAKTAEANELSEKIKTCKKEVVDYDARIDKCKGALHALAAHQTMLDQYGSVIEKIKSYSNLSEDYVQMQKNSASLNNELDELNRRLESVKSQITQAEQKKASLEAIRTQLQNSVLGLDGMILQSAHSNAVNQRAELRNAAQMWDMLAQEYANKEKNEAEISSVSITIETQKSKLKELELKVTEAQKELEIYEKYLNISRADNVRELQRTLKEGEPCPVCGSTHHLIHVSAEERLNNVVNNAERDRDEAREKFNSFYNQNENLRAKQNADVEHYRNLIERRSEIDARITNYRKEWEKYATLDKGFADSSENVNPEARKTLIIQLYENADRTAEETRKRLEEYNKYHNDIEQRTAEIEEINSSLSELKDRRSDIMKQIGTAEGNISTNAENMRVNAGNVQQLYADLEKVLTVADWRQLIRDDAKSLMEKISVFYKERERLSGEQQKFEDEREELRHEASLVEMNLQKTKASINETANKIEETQTSIDSSKNDLFKMFGDADSMQCEEDAKRQLEEARENESKKLAELHKAEQAYTAVEAQCQQAREERKRLDEEKLATETDIDTWISAFNQNHSSVQYRELVDIFSSDNDWKAMREEIKRVENNLSVATERMETAQKELNEWQSRPEHPDRAVETRESINSEIERKRREQNEANAELQDISYKLKLHKDNIAALEQKLPQLNELEKNFNEWKALNDMIGSSNGLAFSRQAQSITLKLLVEHANMQLAMFSPRYRLEKNANDLELEIIDQYMSGRHRPVSSLSGGETFVVSLGLALGLASLSNRQLEIGSLFIDEGFGNLDDESLGIVIRALSNLHAQGRKVGVISHTEQIRDNIFPQIQVVRSRREDCTSSIRVCSL